MEWLHALDLSLISKVAVAGLGGLISGFIGGMVGLALGRPRLLIVYWAADNPINAAGTNILVSAVAALTGTWEHFREGRIDLQVLLLMGIPSALGAFLGGYFGDVVPRAALLVVVGVLTTWYGCTLLLGRRGQRQRNPEMPASGSSAAPTTPALTHVTIRRRLLETGLGFIIGLFGGTVGLILGQLRLPAMIEVLRMDPRVAAGTNLAIGTFTGLFGFVGHLLNFQVDLVVLLFLGSTSIVGSYFGARQTGRISRKTLLQWMGAAMVITSIPIFWVAYAQL